MRTRGTSAPTTIASSSQSLKITIVIESTLTKAFKILTTSQAKNKPLSPSWKPAVKSKANTTTPSV